ncbi:Hypothetical_protein [Hexamita inflata]|uniref:Hypothetical_protein n=1 Tax=Hexamita inflata TaxID=28002 RepID=A0ABP1I9W1_9EUKA
MIVSQIQSNTPKPKVKLEKLAISPGKIVPYTPDAAYSSTRKISAHHLEYVDEELSGSVSMDDCFEPELLLSKTSNFTLSMSVEPEAEPEDEFMVIFRREE